MANKIIKLRRSTAGEVDMTKVAQGLGTKIVEIPEISKTEAEKYELLGSPVMMPEADELFVCSFDSRMLSMYGKFIDDVVGYRVLDPDEEPEFRKQCKEEYTTVVCYYAKKQ